MQDEQEVVGETSGNATRGRGEVGWRLELEGETETLETQKFFGTGHHERRQVKSFRRECAAPGKEGEVDVVKKIKEEGT